MIHVKTNSGGYDITVEKGCFAKLAQLLAGRKAAIVTDETVYRLYGEHLKNQLGACDFQVLALPPGEQTKCMDTLSQLYAFFAQQGISRSDVIVAWGGGVIGDVVGFAAATYLRGVPLIQVPTTLLAQVDSSVGGKVAIDLEQGKNLVGSFYPPQTVLVDPTFLQTLPKRVFCDGMAEVIKYGAIYDEALFAQLLGDVTDHLPAIIRRCVEIKADIVQRDEFDTGERMVLNFGHTFGHVMEQLYHYQTYTHGEAVAMGMARMTEKTEAMGLTKAGTYDKLKEVLLRHNLWFEIPPFDIAQAAQVLCLDKKGNRSHINYVMITQIGTAALLQRPKDDLFLLEG